MNLSVFAPIQDAKITKATLDSSQPTHPKKHPANPLVTRKAPAYASASGELWDGNENKS